MNYLENVHTVKAIRFNIFNGEGYFYQSYLYMGTVYVYQILFSLSNLLSFSLSVSCLVDGELLIEDISELYPNGVLGTV